MRKNIILVGEPMAVGKENNGAFGFAVGLGCGWAENYGAGAGMGFAAWCSCGISESRGMFAMA